MATTVYTDGACLGNPGPGGWAWAVPGGRFASGFDAATTNQRMEIRAALEAVRALEGPLEVVSDSTYVVNCFRDRWWEAWLARGWRTKAGKPVANQDLWEPLIAEVRARGSVAFRWVKGHGTDVMNDLVDRLAVEGATRREGRSGDRPPDDLGPADAPFGVDRRGPAGVGGPAGAGGDPRLPAGRRLAVVGHRPPELGGYDENEISATVRRRLSEILAAKRLLHDDLLVLTGLGLGAEQLGAEAALEAGVPFLVVLPFPDQESVWPAPAQARYRALRGKAQTSVLLQAKKPDSRMAAGRALARRDAWLVAQAQEAIAVWDGDDPVVGRLVRSLEDRVGDDLWVLSPPEASEVPKNRDQRGRPGASPASR